MCHSSIKEEIIKFAVSQFLHSFRSKSANSPEIGQLQRQDSQAVFPRVVLERVKSMLSCSCVSTSEYETIGLSLLQELLNDFEALYE